MPPRPSRSAPIPTLWLAVGVAAVIVLLRIPSFLRPLFDDDEAHIAAIAELVRAGGRLYGDGGVDVRSPGIYWTYLAIFVVAGRYAMWAVHLVSLATVLGTAFILARIAGRFGAPRDGVAAALYYGVFSTVFSSKMLAGHPELFMMLCVSGAVLSLTSDGPGWLGRTLLGGALVGVACLYEQIAILTLILPAFMAPRRGRTVAFALGCLAVLVVAALALAATGSLAGLWHFGVETWLANGASGWRSALFAHITRGFMPFLATSIVVWAGAGLAIWGRAPRILTIWAVVSFASAIADGQFFPHAFLQPLAPLAVLGAMGIRRVRWYTVVATVLPVATCFVLAFSFEPTSGRFGPPSPDHRVPVEWVRAHTSEGDRVFVWGAFPAAYVLADRLPATRFVSFMRVADRAHGAPPEASWDVGPAVWPALADDFAAHPPAVIMDTSSADYASFGHYPMMRFPALKALVDRDYVPAGSPGHVDMYVRRSVPP